MHGEKLWNHPWWFVIHTHPKQEIRADNNLRAWNVETFTPKLKERILNQWTKETSFLIKPLFPRYIFARFKLNDLYHKIRFTRGIHSLISFGDEPTPVDDEIITLIKSRIEDDGYIRLFDSIEPGDEVIVTGGPLKGLSGIFERETKDQDRVRILLKAINYQAHVYIDKDLIEKPFI